MLVCGERLLGRREIICVTNGVRYAQFVEGTIPWSDRNPFSDIGEVVVLCEWFADVRLESRWESPGALVALAVYEDLVSRENFLGS